MAKWQRVWVEIPKAYKPEERQAIAYEVLEYIKKRTLSGVDKEGKPFPKYSKEYVNSLDFRIAGKSKGNVNLKLSGEMLNAMQVLATKSGAVQVGFDKSDKQNNGKAEGNILGTYGSSSPKPGKARDFLGITPSDLKNILAKYPLDDREESLQRAAIVNSTESD